MESIWHLKSHLTYNLLKISRSEQQFKTQNIAELPQIFFCMSLQLFLMSLQFYEKIISWRLGLMKIPRIKLFESEFSAGL